MKNSSATNLFLLISLIVSIMHGTLYGQSTLEKAENNYEQGAYDEALAAWYGLVESGNTASELYYNIGLAESKLNNTGKAMLAFEQALRIKPGSGAIRKAISFERESILDATIPVNPFFLKEWYRQFVMLFRPGVWAILGLGLLIILLIRFLILQKRNPTNWLAHLKNIRFWIAGACMVLLLAFLSYAEIHRDNEAIIGMICTFHQAPSEESPSIKEIGAGEKVVLADQIGEWYYVYLLNQDAGWVRNECLELIVIGRRGKK